MSDNMQKRIFDDKKNRIITGSLRHEVALNICFHRRIVETRCSATGILGRHAAVALMTGCEALPTMYRGPLKLESRDRKREWTVPLEASSGLGLGLTDMVSIFKHLQYRKQQQAKEADRLGPNGVRPGRESRTYARRGCCAAGIGGGPKSVNSIYCGTW